MAPDNPFTPGFGDVPPALSGRHGLVHETVRYMNIGKKTDDLCSILIGTRGVGKTAAMRSIAEHARGSSNWASIYLIARPNPVPSETVPDMIVRKCDALLRRKGAGPRRKLAGLGIGPFTADTHLQDPYRPVSVWEALSEAVRVSTPRIGTGGLILILDEMHNLDEQSAGSVSAALQEIIGDGGKLAFVGAGLPVLEHTIMNDPGFTFFQRCRRTTLRNLSHSDAEEAIRVPLNAHRVSIAPEDLRRLAAGTMGNGYAIQSAGMHAWNLGGGARGSITSEHASQALRLMDADVDRHVVTPTWSHLSPKDLEFLAEMARYPGPVKPVVLTRAMGDSARTYKTRLLHAGVIMDVPGGLLVFASMAVRARAMRELEARRALDDELERRESSYLGRHT